MPPLLLIGTARAAVVVGSEQAAITAVISAKVAVLVEGVLRTMLLTNFKIAGGLFLVAAAIGCFAGKLMSSGFLECGAAVSSTQPVAVEAGLNKAGQDNDNKDSHAANAVIDDVDCDGFPDVIVISWAGLNKLRQDAKDNPSAKPVKPAVEADYERLEPQLRKLLAEKKTDDEVLDAIYQATLVRKPTEMERKSALRQVGKQTKAPLREKAFQNLLFGLVSSQEFGRHELQGTWRTAPDKDKLNKDKPGAADAGLSVTILGDRFTVKLDGKVTAEGTYIFNPQNRLLPFKGPKEFNLDFSEGDLQDRICDGIYEVDGDTLRVCFNHGDESARPGEFTKTTDKTLWVLQRERPKKK